MPDDFAARPEAVADAGEIARLAALDSMAYDRERQAVAERLGVRVTTLDLRVDDTRPKPDAAQGRNVALPEADPWPDPVPAAPMLDRLAQIVRRHVILSPAAADCTALWIAHTWVADRFQHSPRLSITSPVKRCGKSTLLDVLRATAFRAMKADNISASGVFRTVEALRPLTLLIDEADSFLGENEELRGVLNSGFERSGEVVRVVEVKDEWQPIRFATFCPVALAGIGALPSTLEDRAVPIVLQRKGAAETVTKLRAPGARDALHIAARCLARWAADRGPRLSTDPPVPDAMGDREGDISIPLLAIADDAGGVWPARGRAGRRWIAGWWRRC
jgi:putative DNA primase/helicase